jgi:hypothetical protein
VLHWKVTLVCVAAIALALAGGFGHGLGSSGGLDQPGLLGLYW